MGCKYNHLRDGCCHLDNGSCPPPDCYSCMLSGLEMWHQSGLLSPRSHLPNHQDCNLFNATNAGDELVLPVNVAATPEQTQEVLEMD